MGSPHSKSSLGIGKLGIGAHTMAPVARHRSKALITMASLVTDVRFAEIFPMFFSFVRFGQSAQPTSSKRSNPFISGSANLSESDL